MAFTFTFSCTWAQVQSKLHKMQKKIMFSISGVLWTELEPKYIKGSIEMPLWFLLKFPTITIVSSCSCYWHKSFFSSKSINNVVKSSFQSFLDLGGRGGAVCEVEWIREVKSLKSSSSSGRANLALEMVPWWERWWKKCDWKKEFWETQCVCTVCSEKMVMEDVHLKNQAGEHEGELMMRLVKNSSKVLKGVYHNSLAR